MKLRIDFDNIRKHILIEATIPTLEDVFSRPLRHSSTTIGSVRSMPISDYTMMLSQLSSRSPQSDSYGKHRGSRSRGTRPQCTYCNRLGHTGDCFNPLHGCALCTAHVTQTIASSVAESSSPSSTPESAASSLGITLTLKEYANLLCLTRATFQLLMSLLPNLVMPLLTLLAHRFWILVL